MEDLVEYLSPFVAVPRVGTVRRFDAERRLRNAIEQGEVEVWFQPQVRLSTGHVVG